MSEESRKPLGVPDVVSYLAVAACVILSILCLIGSFLESGYLHDSLAYFLLNENREYEGFELLLFNAFIVYIAASMVVSPLFPAILCNMMRNSYHTGKATGGATVIVCLLAPFASFLPFLVFGGIPLLLITIFVQYIPTGLWFALLISMFLYVYEGMALLWFYGTCEAFPSDFTSRFKSEK